MQEKINKKKVHRGLAIGEIILLITSIVAFSFILGNSFSVVSAAEGGCPSDYGITSPGDEKYDYKCDSNDKYSSCEISSGNIKSGQDACIVEKSHRVYIFCCEGEDEEEDKTSDDEKIKNMFVAMGAKEGLDKLVAEVKKKVGVDKLGLEEAVKKVAEEAGLKKTGWFGKLYGKFAAGEFRFLTYAGIAVGATAIITFFIVLGKTGDSAKAVDVAFRTGIGAAAGVGAYYLAGLVGIGPGGWVAAGFVMLGIWASKFLKREEDRSVTFVCKPWQAQIKGTNCESCNDGIFPCTEYQCKSLGTGCEIINKDTDEPRCVWKDPRDVNPPEIQAWEETLTEGYEYVPLPPVEGTGVEIKYGGSDDGCSPAFQPFTFGVDLSKDGYCRIDSIRTDEFSEMDFDFGGKNLYMKQHTQEMTFPGVANFEQGGINITNDGELEFYVRCEAATNGKSNRDEFIFKFCIDKGPDTTSPIIRNFNKNDGAPIAYFEEGETKEIDIQAYVNEPTECKWSHGDKSYENMENNLICGNELGKYNAQLSYTCSGKLTDLENNRENNFFFRCNDSFGNVNIQSTTLKLIGTQPLFISSVEPNATTIKGSTDNVKVTLEAETSAGYENGKATCEYSTTGTSGSYLLFSPDITRSHQHSTEIRLLAGEHNYFIRCFDLAGNSDSREISFTVETDTGAPTVVRIFRDGSNLKVITNEEAVCVYDNTDCLYGFEDGLEMITTDEKMHSTIWDSNKNFYIKCQDEFENQPAPQSCSIIARPFEI